MSRSSSDPTEADAARWMVDQVQSNALFYHDAAAHLILKLFGGRFVYQKASGNLAISKSLLRLFDELTEEDVVWDRSECCWRMRRLSDKPGRAQT